MSTPGTVFGNPRLPVPFDKHRNFSVFDANPAYFVEPHYARREGHDDCYAALVIEHLHEQDEATDIQSFWKKQLIGLSRPASLPMVINASSTAFRSVSVDFNAYKSFMNASFGFDISMNDGSIEHRTNSTDDSCLAVTHRSVPSFFYTVLIT